MKKLIKKMLLIINGIIPKNAKKIILESSPDFSDNAKSLYDYLLMNARNKYLYIWIVDNPSKYRRSNNTIFISKNNKLKYLYHVFTSKYVFWGNKGVFGSNPKKQIVVNMTHGLPYKTSKGYLHKDEDFTYLVSSSDKISPILADEFYSTSEKCIVTGLPRNDVLFQKNEIVKQLKSKYSKLIIWLPTLKKHKNSNDFIIDNYNVVPIFNNNELVELNNKLKEKNILLILKFHPAQDLSTLNSESLSNIYLWKNEELEQRNINLYSLLAYSDALITDYSSVSADYLLLDKQIGYTRDDMEIFNEKRGFCFENIEEMSPGEKIYNREDFAIFIDNVYNNIDKYKKERKIVRDFYYQYKDNKSTERLVDYFNL